MKPSQFSSGGAMPYAINLTESDDSVWKRLRAQYPDTPPSQRESFAGFREEDPRTNLVSELEFENQNSITFLYGFSRGPGKTMIMASDMVRMIRMMDTGYALLGVRALLVWLEHRVEFARAVMKRYGTAPIYNRQYRVCFDGCIIYGAEGVEWSIPCLIWNEPRSKEIPNVWLGSIAYTVPYARPAEYLSAASYIGR